MHKREYAQYAIRNTKHVYVVILVGGMGKRLRPLSTDAKPKAFLSVTRDRKTMFARTLDRALKLVSAPNIVVVANKAHGSLVKKDFPEISKRNLILESVSRNTAPAMALAASILKKRDPNSILVGIWSDQYIIGEPKYIDSLMLAVEFIRKNRDALIVLGVKPLSPSTQLGYVRVTGNGLRVTGIRKIEEFIEKPDLSMAKRFVKSGHYLWHAGGLIFRAGTILRAFKEHAPEIYDLVNRAGNIDKYYKETPDISIDYAVMEKADNVYCVEGSYNWVDMGSFDNLRAILERESRDFILKDGKIVKIL
ncbi:MAG: mannose-1-phosphate guanylyltransferase [Candidatus Omnitrophica bacterium]|nr:mannose-1-phosphate guanylyltransferase [Candidatus Omnitrophota bacterium]